MTKATPAAGVATGQCLCGSVAFEIDVPAPAGHYPAYDKLAPA